MGEGEGLAVLSELEGVIIRSEFVVVLELDRECCFVLRGSPKDLFVVVPVIAQKSGPTHTQYTVWSRKKWLYVE